MLTVALEGNEGVEAGLFGVNLSVFLGLGFKNTLNLMKGKKGVGGDVSGFIVFEHDGFVFEEGGRMIFFFFLFFGFVFFGVVGRGDLEDSINY